MEQLPLAVSPFKAVGLAGHHGLFVAILEHDIDPLNRANDSHVAVHDDVGFENVHLA